MIDFEVGERVFFFELKPKKFPLGVITGIQEDLVYDADKMAYVSNQPYHYTVEVSWDNGVVALHEPEEVGSIEKIIKLLSQPVL